VQVLKQPQAIFGLPASDRGSLAAFDQYLAKVADSLSACVWNRDVIEILDLLPQVFLRLDDHVEVPVDSLKVLTQHMNVVLQSYQKDLNPQLEDMLLLSSEYTYHLLSFFRENPAVRPSYPIENYKRSMLLDPEWALRWCCEQNDAVFYNEVMQHLHKTKDFNQRSAIVFHRLKVLQMDRPTALADIHSRLPMLLRDPQVCLWILDNYPEIDRKILFRSAFGNPAYLLLWGERFPGEFDALIKRELLRYPAWLADYIVRFRPGDARDLWIRARERCSNQWLLPWVEQYGIAAKWF
jgi:hypothetical protein